MIEASGDVDVYKFSLSMPRLSINAVVSGIAGTRGLVLDLHDVSGKLLGSTRVGQASAAITLQVAQPSLNQAVYLVVKGVGPRDTEAPATAVVKYALTGKAS